jgi:SAM-dependent methyltransferase
MRESPTESAAREGGADRSNGYERIAPVFLAGRGGPTSNAIGAARVRAWARALPLQAAVLDLGCGSGIPITQVLVEARLAVHAVDASPTMFAAFRANFPLIPVACEPAEESPFFHRSFDGIVAWGLLFLLPPTTQVALLGRIASALRPRGRLLFTSPAAACSWTDVLTDEQSRSLGSESYRETLAREGFTEISEYDDEGQNHYYDARR